MKKYARILDEIKALEKELKFLKEVVKTKNEKACYSSIQEKSNRLKSTLYTIASR